ncbi:hypothetical protein ACHAXS_004679 [Conticribra weissflogii]
MSINTNYERLYDSNSAFQTQNISIDSEIDDLLDDAFLKELETELNFLQQLSTKRKTVIHHNEQATVLVYPKVDSEVSSTFSRRKNVNIEDLMDLFREVGLASGQTHPDRSIGPSSAGHKRGLESFPVSRMTQRSIQNSSPTYAICRCQKKQRRRFSRVAKSA